MMFLDFKRHLREKYFEFLKGKFSKRFFKRKLVPSCVFLYIFFIYLAYLFFPSDYSIMTNAISDLGNPDLNPIGWIFFSFGFMSLSIFFIPLYMYMYRRLVHVDKVLARVARFGSYVASFGMFLLCFFPNTKKDIGIHGIAAVLSFSGLATSAIFSWLTSVKFSVIRAHKQRKWLEFSVLLMISILLSCLMATGISEVLFEEYHGKAKIWFLLYPFWEWMTLFDVLFEIVLMFFIIPEEINVNFLEDKDLYFKME
ncbi:MAG: DUF998 domain-containing protein [Promethearchaeota archaeon]